MYDASRVISAFWTKRDVCHYPNSTGLARTISDALSSGAPDPPSTSLAPAMSLENSTEVGP
jgi:hypothetical protein